MGSMIDESRSLKLDINLFRSIPFLIPSFRSKLKIVKVAKTQASISIRDNTCSNHCISNKREWNISFFKIKNNLEIFQDLADFSFEERSKRSTRKRFDGRYFSAMV